MLLNHGGALPGNPRTCDHRSTLSMVFLLCFGGSEAIVVLWRGSKILSPSPLVAARADAWHRSGNATRLFFTYYTNDLNRITAENRQDPSNPPGRPSAARQVNIPEHGVSPGRWFESVCISFNISSCCHVSRVTQASPWRHAWPYRCILSCTTWTPFGSNQVPRTTQSLLDGLACF